MMKVTLFVLCTVLVTVNLSLAQSQSDTNTDGSQLSTHQHPNIFGIQFPFEIPHFPFFGGRQRREAEETPTKTLEQEDLDEDHLDHENRFFFGLFKPTATYVSCNSTTQAGATCLSCTQALTCGSNNVGRLYRCRGFLPYCNVGRCSFFPGELCANATG